MKIQYEDIKMGKTTIKENKQNQKINKKIIEKNTRKIVIKGG